jgi:hypothetical protein
VSGSLLLLEDVAAAAAPLAPKTTRRFTVWCGSSINRAHRTVEDLARATFALLPRGTWDEVELLIKAGEGGSWQSNFDAHPLALSGPFALTQLVAEGRAVGLRITPYVVVRARSAWIADEQRQIRQCVAAAGRCVLNVEPGTPYYNGPNDPRFIRGVYLAGIGVPADAIEVCMIPRAGQVNELGGRPCIEAWTDPTLVGAASWECYGLAAWIPGPTSLLVDEAIARLDGWGVPQELRYRIPVVQRDERDRWAQTIWCAQGMAVWYLDGN